MNTLIERLGKSSDKLVTMISCQEYAYFEWKSKVKETLRKKNIALVQELILRKEARDASVNLVLQEQFYQYIQEIVNGKEGEISSLEEAIRLTNPDFTGRIAAEGLFSIQELDFCFYMHSVGYSGKKSDFSASGVSILSVCDWRGKCTETVFVVQRSI